MVVFGELDCHVVVVFQFCKIFKMTSKMAAKKGGNHMIFEMVHCTEKITAFYLFVMVIAVVFVLVIVSINPCSTFKTTFGQI